MSAVRDWLTTLWPGSYKGFSFYFDKEESEGGRDLVKHQFPHRDDPYIEDMGEALREYSGDLYVHGDDADSASARLEETFASIGPGILVVPIRGPVSVHCERFKRVHDKDKLGYVAFNVKFVRAGAATALISVPLAGRLVLDAGDRLASALANVFGAGVTVTGAPDYVVEAAVDQVQGGLAALDVTRQAWAVDPATSATVRDAVAGIVAAVPVMLARAAPALSDVQSFAASVAKLVPAPAADGPTLLAQSVVATARALGEGMPPATAQAAFAAIVDAFAPPAPLAALADAYAPPRAPSSLAPALSAAFAPPVTAAAPTASRNATLAAKNIAEADRLTRLSALIAWCEAVTLRSYASRPDGIAARAEAADRFEIELNQASGAEGAALFVAIEDLRGRVIEYLSRLITDLAPVVQIEASLSMPSLFWAWRLYADPTRAAELVARNSVRHPSFMPLTFSALAPR